MPLPDEFLQELKARNSISDVVSDYVVLKRAGRNMSGLCPFHGEKTPSFVVYPETESFYCFGCGAGGEVINFIKKIENLDYIEAVKFLAQRAGMQMPENNIDDSLSKLKSRIYEANRVAARYYNSQLYKANGKQSLDYLHKRGLSDNTIKHFGLGYAPENRGSLVNYMRQQGFKDSELMAANLTIKSYSSTTIDRFANRVMFPIIDLRGNVVAFGGRIMTDQKPKYLNTSDTLVFKKSLNLFALNFAKNSGKRQLILAEGYMDVIALFQAGFTNTVATLGTSLTIEQATIIKRYADEIVICYDADEAGQKAASRAITLLRNAGILIRVLAVPGAKDPDEYIRKHKEDGSARFKQLLENSENDVEYRLQKLKTGYNLNQTEGMVGYLTEAAKILATLNNPIEIELYASKLSAEAGLQKDSVMQQIKKYSKKDTLQKHKTQFREIQGNLSGRNDKINKEKYSNLRSAKAEEALIAYLINHQDMVTKVTQKLPPEKMLTDFNRRVYSRVAKRAKENRPATLTDLAESFSTEENSKIAEMLAKHSKGVSTPITAQEYINVILSENDKKTVKEAPPEDIDAVEKYLKNLKEKKS